MKQFTRLYNSLGMLAMFCLASCASEELNDRLLPEGKYPMSFTTAVEGQIPTRATTDNTWNGDEQVALAIGDEVKQYTPDNTGSLASLTSTDPFYWQTANETKIVRAWYCGAEYNAAQPTRLTVQTDQSGDGYKQSNFLYASPQEVTFSDRNDAQLTFKHLPAKVVIHLTNGNGLTARDVENATVYLVNQATTSGEIDWENSTVEQTTPCETEILTNVLAESVEDYQKSVQALVVPQQMQNKKFIKVTIGKDAAAHDYFYTPKEETDANLECGMQYTYNITVTKGEELVVTTTEPSISWEDGIASSDDGTEAKSFYVTCPSSSDVTSFTISNSTYQDGDRYTVNANTTITISYKTTSKIHCYKLVQGIANVSTSTGDRTNITHSVSDIRGDLVFSFDEYAEVGDYYYADGSWSPDYTLGNGSHACIGIVFKVGAGTGDHASYYGNKLPKGIRGYVAALRDANNGNQLVWSTETTVTGVSTSQANFDGYCNTQIIKRIPGYETKYPAFQSCIENNATAAPAASSGWYLPSCAQIRAFHDVHNSVGANLSNANGDLLIKANTGDKRGDYWTSNEVSSDRTKVWHFSTYAPDPFYNDNAKTASDKDLVRAILTF